MIAVMPLREGEEHHVLALAKAMHAESPVYSPYPFDDDRLLEWINLCLTHEDWLCLVAWDEGLEPIGFIAVGSGPMLFSKTRNVDDLGLYVRPEWRGTTAAVRLVRQMEGWAKSKGAVIRLGVTTGTNSAQAVKFLERFGYRQTGVLLTKPT